MPSLNTGNAILSNPIKVDSSYNVGIGGAASGSFKLQVTGTTNLTGALTGTSAGLSSTLSAMGTNIQFNLDGTFGANYYTMGFGGVSNGFNRIAGGTGTTDGLYITSATGRDIAFRTNGSATTSMLITSGGNVGIGTISPTNLAASYRSLCVNGSSAGFFETRVSDVSSGRFISDSNGTGIGDVRSGKYLYLYTEDTERMRISSTGAITMSVPTSGQTLTVNGKNNNWTQEVIGSSTTGQSYGLLVTAGTNSADNSFYVQNAAGNTKYLQVRGDGLIGLSGATYNRTASGAYRTIYMGDDTYLGGVASIRASKKNIETNIDIDWIYQLKPVTFNYRKKDEDGNFTDEAYNELNYGLIAEDTSLVADFLCNYDETEETKKLIGIEYSRLITPMLKAIQSQQAQIESQQQQINSLINR